MLVVEDDPAIAWALRQALAMEGHEVVVEPDGLAGLGRLQTPPLPRNHLRKIG